MSVVLPCRCCNVAVGWHFHTAKFCAQSLNLYPGILKYFTLPYKNISILIKVQFRQNILNILLLFQSKYFKWTKYFLTASASLEEMISCRARTERACSITNTHWERSGGTFWNSKIVNFELLQCFTSALTLSTMLSRKHCLFPNPSAERQTLSPVPVQERHTMSSWRGIF